MKKIEFLVDPSIPIQNMESLNTSFYRLPQFKKIIQNSHRS